MKRLLHAHFIHTPTFTPVPWTGNELYNLVRQRGTAPVTAIYTSSTTTHCDQTATRCWVELTYLYPRHHQYTPQLQLFNIASAGIRHGRQLGPGVPRPATGRARCSVIHQTSQTFRTLLTLGQPRQPDPDCHQGQTQPAACQEHHI
jgi:hypothetical protein